MPSLEATLARTRAAIDHETPTVADLIEGLGDRSHSTMLMVPAAIIITPLSGIPGLSSAGGIAIALIALQALLGRDHVWFPGWMRRLKLPRDRFDRLLGKLERPARWMDDHTGKRATIFTRGPGRILIYVFCMLCGGVMPLLELLPFTSSILASAVMFFAVALTTRDGLLALFGFATIAAAVTTGLSLT